MFPSVKTINNFVAAGHTLQSFFFLTSCLKALTFSELPKSKLLPAAQAVGHFTQCIFVTVVSISALLCGDALPCSQKKGLKK